MNNAPAILRSLIIYAVCVPLAVIVGYKLTDPLDFTTFAYAGILGMLLAIPLLLRWHYPLLLFSLNASMYMFFLKGRPEFLAGDGGVEPGHIAVGAGHEQSNALYPACRK